MLSSFETTYAVIGLILTGALLLASGPGIVVFQIVKFLCRGVWFMAQTGLQAFFHGTDRDTRRYRDPIMDIIAENPVNSLAFVRRVICVASLSSVISAAPCIVYLSWSWERCQSCDKPLRWWLLIHCLVALLQLPLRIVFSLRLRHLASRRIDLMTHGVHRLTSGRAWWVSKILSLASYGWFAVGVFWTFTTASCVSAPFLLNASIGVIVLSLLRLFLTLGSFYYYFPSPPATPMWAVLRDGQARNGVAGGLIAGLRPSALDRKEIETLPSRKYCDLIELTPNGSKKRVAEICPICLTEFEAEELIRDLPQCSHPFHVPCIDKWLENCGACPLCQRVVANIS